jgi:hypothetical protein
MRTILALSGVMAALIFGAPAYAFQETPAPPPSETSEAAPKADPQFDALQLGTPGLSAPQPEKGGLNLFGYTVLPKLNFGLDVLYGQDQQQLELQGPTTLDENGDVSVLGKVKRRF